MGLILIDAYDKILRLIFNPKINTIMRNLIFAGLIFLMPVGYGQSPTGNESSDKFIYKNIAELEIFGHGSFYSINYERLIFNGERFKTSAQAGFAYYPESSGVIPLWIPLTINQMLSFGSHHLEVGLGQIIINDRLPNGVNDYILFGSLRAGYRYQKPGGRIMFKLSFTPIVDYWDRVNPEFATEYVEFIPWGGLTIGYNF